jgi:hypothetical protein
MKLNKTLCLLTALFAMAILAAGCDKGSDVDNSDAAKPSKEKYHYVIHQPNTDHPNDDVLIWDTPTRNKRKFKLAPGTRVKVLKTTEENMYKIKTTDGREGWVPAKWCRKKKGR